MTTDRVYSCLRPSTKFMCVQDLTKIRPVLLSGHRVNFEQGLVYSVL